MSRNTRGFGELRDVFEWCNSGDVAKYDRFGECESVKIGGTSGDIYIYIHVCSGL